MKPALGLPLAEQFLNETAKTLGDLPKEATLAISALFNEVDYGPQTAEEISFFKKVPAIWIEVPVETVKAAYMTLPEISESHKTFDEYHAWYTSHGDTPDYGLENRYPCIASHTSDDVVMDGSHRLHAYIKENHPTVPIIVFNGAAWWIAHNEWQKSTNKSWEKDRSLSACY